MREYGTSLATLLPFSWGPWGYERAVELAKDCGFTGRRKFQVLPIWGLNVARRDLDETTISYEDAWEYYHLIETIRNTVRDKKLSHIRNWLLFSRETMRWIDNAQCSVHHFYDVAGTHPDLNCVSEIHPELSLSIADYVDFASGGGHLCWDTRHVRRKHRDGSPNLDWRSLLEALPSDSIKLIHVQPLTDYEKVNFASVGRLTELGAMLIALREKVGEDVPAIIEIQPPLFQRRSTMVKYLSAFLAKTKQLLR